MATRTDDILVVEDNIVNSELTAKILDHMQLPAVIQSNGEDALAWCEAHIPRLILMDISLPGMDGLEVTRELRRKPEFAEVPIVALTAHALGSWAEQTRQAGCNAYIAKPITPRQLMARITEVLEESS